jgi:hypothetical protein
MARGARPRPPRPDATKAVLQGNCVVSQPGDPRYPSAVGTRDSQDRPERPAQTAECQDLVSCGLAQDVAHALGASRARRVRQHLGRRRLIACLRCRLIVGFGCPPRSSPLRTLFATCIFVSLARCNRQLLRESFRANLPPDASFESRLESHLINCWPAATSEVANLHYRKLLGGTSRVRAFQSDWQSRDYQYN